MEHLTIPEAAKRLGVSRATLWRRVTAGEIEATRLLGRGPFRIAADVVERLCAPPVQEEAAQGERRGS